MVLTKAIVKKTYTTDSNYYSVYIPLLRKANDSEEDATLQATRIEIAGIKDDIKVGDVVYVGFEDDKYGKPIILGKLFTGQEADISSNQSLRTLAVSDKAQLPGDTTIGDTNLDDFKNIINEDLIHKQEALTLDSVKVGTLSTVIGFNSAGKVVRTRLADISTTYLHSVEIIDVTWSRVGSSWVENKTTLGYVKFESTFSTPLTFQNICSTVSATNTALPLYYDNGASKIGYSIYPTRDITIESADEEVYGDTLGQEEDPFAHVALPGTGATSWSSLVTTIWVEESVNLVYINGSTLSRSSISHEYEGLLPGPRIDHFETKDTVVELSHDTIVPIVDPIF